MTADDGHMQVLHPFLALAAPVSDGLLVQSFRECWACAPWGQATFHARHPGKPGPASAFSSPSVLRAWHGVGPDVTLHVPMLWAWLVACCLGFLPVVLGLMGSPALCSVAELG